jgi:hypothetical protein
MTFVDDIVTVVSKRVKGRRTKKTPLFFGCLRGSGVVTACRVRLVPDRKFLEMRATKKKTPGTADQACA